MAIVSAFYSLDRVTFSSVFSANLTEAFLAGFGLTAFFKALCLPEAELEVRRPDGFISADEVVVVLVSVMTLVVMPLGDLLFFRIEP